MRRMKGIAKAVVTIAGAISLSSPLFAASHNAVAQKAPPRQKDSPGIITGKQLQSVPVIGDSFLDEQRGDATDMKR